MSKFQKVHTMQGCSVSIYLPQTPPGSLFGKWKHSKYLSSEGLGGTLKVDLEGHHRIWKAMVPHGKTVSTVSTCSIPRQVQPTLCYTDSRTPIFSPVIGGWLVCWCWECGRFVPCSPKTVANGHLDDSNQIWKVNFRLLLSCFYTNHQTQQAKIGNFNVSWLTKLTWAHAILQVSPEIQPIRLPPFCIHSACMAVTLQSQESVAIQLDQDCMIYQLPIVRIPHKYRFFKGDGSCENKPCCICPFEMSLNLKPNTDKR